jgi:hypothetical protein
MVLDDLDFGGRITYSDVRLEPKHCIKTAVELLDQDCWTTQVENCDDELLEMGAAGTPLRQLILDILRICDYCFMRPGMTTKYYDA